jgi:hypothetical membrane protein
MTAGASRRGPLVHRSARHGAALLVFGAVEFIVGMIVTQIGYPGYSLSRNVISDLGNTGCGYWGGSGSFTGDYACSPWHIVFNASIVIMGIALIGAVLLLRTAFPPRRTRTIGLALLGVAAIGSIGVGLSPENVNITVHSVSALLAFLGSGLALLFLGIAMFRDTRWDGFRTFTVVCGLVDLVALALFVSKTYLHLGAGGMERLIVAPVLLWAIVAGLHLLRIPTYAPSGLRAA